MVLKSLGLIEDNPAVKNGDRHGELTLAFGLWDNRTKTNKTARAAGVQKQKKKGQTVHHRNVETFVCLFQQQQVRKK